MPAVEVRASRPWHVLDRSLSALCLHRQRWQQQQGGWRCQRQQQTVGVSALSNCNSNSTASPLLCSLAFMAAVQPGNSGGREPPQIVGAATLLGGGTAAHAAMTALGCVLGDAAGLGVTAQLAGTGLSLSAALGYILPLAGMCLAGTAAAERLEEFAKLKRVFQAELIPQLAQLPIWGLGLLALGAGVGEETLFRGFLQSAAIQGLAGVLPAEFATACGLAAGSVVFGALHALTPSYFLFATAAGFVFGSEYLQYGLQTAAATHWLYDWAALIYIIGVWGGGGSDDGSSRGGGGSNREAGSTPKPGSLQQDPELGGR